MAGGKEGANRQTGTRALRWVVGVVAGLLVVVVAGFVIVGRYRVHNYLANLPKRLGVDVEQETNGFTYSQSSKGKKIFTVHASKEVQHKDGRITLHDVGIVLFGPDGEATDRIHGANFEYDKTAEMLRAEGEVYIELTPPASRESVRGRADDAEARMVHVKTMGLVFDQKAQTATTDGAVEFRSGGYSGNAVGAGYDARSGVVVLRSAVRMSGLRNERPVMLTASRAEMDRPTRVIDLENAKYGTTTESGAQSVAAGHAVVHTTADGTPQRVDAEGDVRLTGDRRGTVAARRAAMELGASGQARAMHLWGEVRYASGEGVKRMNGSAEDARVAFDEAGRPVHAAFLGAAGAGSGAGGVRFVEEGGGVMRQLDAGRVEVALSGGGKEPTLVRGAEAWGANGARLQLVGETAKGRSTTEVKADKLTGRFAAGGRTSELTGLDGVGHSWVQRIALNAAGVQQSRDTSAGDVLHVDFKPGGGGKSELVRAEQRGGVTTVYEALRAAGGSSVEHARADDAMYEAADDVVHLKGAVEVQDEASALFADGLDLDRGSGDATAHGAVKVSYTSGAAGGGQQEPVHVLAGRAVAHKASGMVEFFADAGGQVRMWQGTSQVEAPRIDLFQKEKRMVAQGEDAAAVRTVLDGGSGSNGKKTGGLVRVLSRSVVYADAARTVEFKGGVRVVDQDGVMTSQDATVWLSSRNAGGASKSEPGGMGLMGGKVDHMVASGGVQLDQAGRRGTGEKLVYTASDEVFVLTGTKAVPPKVVDQAQGGMTTGAALRFRTGDDSVEVLGGVAGSDGKSTGRVRSETRVRQ